MLNIIQVQVRLLNGLQSFEIAPFFLLQYDGFSYKKFCSDNNLAFGLFWIDNREKSNIWERGNSKCEWVFDSQRKQMLLSCWRFDEWLNQWSNRWKIFRINFSIEHVWMMKMIEANEKHGLEYLRKTGNLSSKCYRNSVKQMLLIRWVHRISLSAYMCWDSVFWRFLNYWRLFAWEHAGLSMEYIESWCGGDNSQIPLITDNNNRC